MTETFSQNAEMLDLLHRTSEAAFGALIQSLAAGGKAVQAFFRSGMRALGNEAAAKAAFELAEGFASIFSLTKGGPAGAAAHFRAAGLYAAAAAAFGAGAAFGGGGGGGGGGVSASATQGGTQAVAGEGGQTHEVRVIGRRGDVYSYEELDALFAALNELRGQKRIVWELG